MIQLRSLSAYFITQFDLYTVSWTRQPQLRDPRVAEPTCIKVRTTVVKQKKVLYGFTRSLQTCVPAHPEAADLDTDTRSIAGPTGRINMCMHM